MVKAWKVPTSSADTFPILTKHPVRVEDFWPQLSSQIFNASFLDSAARPGEYGDS